MEGAASIAKARILFGNNFIGAEELSSITALFPVHIPDKTPEIPYTERQLVQAKDDYLLTLGSDKFNSNQPLNLLSLRAQYGTNPEISEPCFYNQDWYMAEDFIKKTAEAKWYLLKKEVLPDTRAKLPFDLLKKGIHFPSAILCAYAFFVYYFIRKEFLWYHDFIWCSDTDHNGDRIYVGKYNDIDGINKNGFSIHRYLGLRNCYGAINSVKG